MTRRRFQTTVTTCAILALVSLSVAGCGRKGPLEEPPDPLVEQARAKDPNAKPKKRKRTPIRAPSEPFILDQLV